MRPRRTITPADLPALRAALLRDLGPVSEPASYSVADVFQATVLFLRGEAEYRPGRVYGFLSAPIGVSEPVCVSAADLRKVAQGIDLSRYLPSSFDVGDVRIGPADFLFAALDVLLSGAGEVTVSPRDQLGSFAPVQALEQHRIAGPGKWCIHATDFSDRFLSDRLRWQLWTARHE